MCLWYLCTVYACQMCMFESIHVCIWKTSRGFWLSSSMALKSYSLETGSLTELQNHHFGWVSRLASKLIGSTCCIYAHQYWLEVCEATASCLLTRMLEIWIQVLIAVQVLFILPAISLAPLIKLKKLNLGLLCILI